MRHLERSRTRALGVLCALGLGLGAGGCAPQSPDSSSWRDQAYQTLDDVSSNVATASLLLKQVQGGRVFGKYAQIVALNAETNAGKVTSKFSAEQPVPSDAAAYQHVTTKLLVAGGGVAGGRVPLGGADHPPLPEMVWQVSGSY